ncbi:MAG: hypothetical protein AAFQ41_04645 [Cyanobacteria bacterium J06623_7]
MAVELQNVVSMNLQSCRHILTQELEKLADNSATLLIGFNPGLLDLVL